MNMRIGICSVIVILLAAIASRSQDLDPRAYVWVPVDGTLIVAGGGYSAGSVLTDPTLPLEDLEATVVSGSLGVGRTFSLFGVTAQALLVGSYASVNASATVMGQYESVTRNGFGDTRFRFSILPIGAPATQRSEFGKVKHSTIVGASVTVMIPTGAYYPEKLINIGTNRWSFKPEIALSQPLGDSWLLDVYAGVWLFTQNTSFYPGTSVRSQDPMAALQGHLSYAFTRQMWTALNVTYYVGGNSQVNGVTSNDEQNNLRIGGTFVLPVGAGHAIKVAVSTGAIVRFGANFTTLSLAWNTSFF
ncbi:MAG: transporter [Ignavibacteria bacterium]|nr:transporter [Ignavibacteria bacterium]